MEARWSTSFLQAIIGKYTKLRRKENVNFKNSWKQQLNSSIYSHLENMKGFEEQRQARTKIQYELEFHQITPY